MINRIKKYRKWIVAGIVCVVAITTIVKTTKKSRATEIDVEAGMNYIQALEKSDISGTEEKIEEMLAAEVIKGDPIEPPAKTVYLTFDDGPGPYTEELLEILDRYDVKATFFVVNTAYSDLIAKEYEAGHTIGIHSATHDFEKIYASEEAYFEDLQEMQDIIVENTGKKTNLIRFPGGSSNLVSDFNPGIMTRLTQDVNDKGYQYFDWNITSGDAGDTTSTEVVYQNVINGMQSQDVSIVLQHDIKKFSVDAVEAIIQWGLANGYTFEPLDIKSPPKHHSVNN